MQTSSTSAELPKIERRYRIHHDRPRATMVASTDEIHQFLAFLWGDAELIPKRIPRFSLDIWLDILLRIRDIVDDDAEKHRYSAIKASIKNPYPDNVFSWMLNQLVELGFLIRKRDPGGFSPKRGVRYYLTENGVTLIKMFETMKAQKESEGRNRPLY